MYVCLSEYIDTIVDSFTSNFPSSPKDVDCLPKYIRIRMEECSRLPTGDYSIRLEAYGRVSII